MSERRACRSVARAVALAVVTLLAAAHEAHACATCFGDPQSAVVQGMNDAILLLLGIVAMVFVFFIRVFLEFRRRAHRVAERERQFRLIHGGAR